MEERKWQYSFADNGDFSFLGTIKYAGHIDSDGNIRMPEQYYDVGKVAAIRKDLFLQMVGEIPPDEWRVEWIRCVGEENLPPKFLQQYRERWGLEDDEIG